MSKTIREVALEAIKIIGQHDEGAAMDSGFDGGEFSGPAHARQEEKEITDLAEANGFEFDQVMDEVMRISNEEYHETEPDRFETYHRFIDPLKGGFFLE